MKHIELFKDGFDSTVQEKIQPENWPYVGYSPSEGLRFTVILTPQPDNEIWYTSIDGDIVGFDDSLCNTTLVSNTYKDGKGVAKFKDPITYISSKNIQFIPSQDYGRTFINSGLLTLSLPNSLQRIETASLFYYLDIDSVATVLSSVNLNELTLGSNLESIYKYPGFGNIDKVNFKGSLTNWLNIDFNYSEELPDIHIEDGDPANNINPISDSFYINDELFTDLIVPDSITELKPYVFSKCKSLKSITLHDNIQTIGAGAFERCTGLTSIDLGNVQTIGDDAFKRCTGLTSIDLGNVQIIGNYAFNGCTGLTSLTIPSTVTSIGYNAFSGLVINPDNFINNSALDADANNYWGAKVIIVTENGLEVQGGTKIIGYRGGSGTEDEPKYINIPTYITEIDDDAIYGIKNVYLTYDGSETEWNAIKKPGYDFDWCMYSTSPGEDGYLIIKLKDKEIKIWTCSA